MPKGYLYASFLRHVKIYFENMAVTDLASARARRKNTFARRMPARSGFSCAAVCCNDTCASSLKKDCVTTLIPRRAGARHRSMRE